jgi:hypothetical protein
MNIALILLLPCVTQSKPARFRCFIFLPYFTAFFGLTGRHQVYRVFLRNMLYFPFGVFDASRCIFQDMLRHSFVSDYVFGLFVEYVASIFYGVVFALPGSACFPSIWLCLLHVRSASCLSQSFKRRLCDRARWETE